MPAENKPQDEHPAKDNRMMLNAMIYWLNTGIAWRDLPDRFGSAILNQTEKNFSDRIKTNIRER